MKRPFWLFLGLIAVITIAAALAVRLSRPRGYLRTDEPLLHWETTAAAFAAGSRELQRPRGTFTLVNPGRDAVRILDVQTSCGCSQPEIDRRLIGPGESIQVLVSAPLAPGLRTYNYILHTDSAVQAELPL